jgi:hypothetical protein
MADYINTFENFGRSELPKFLGEKGVSFPIPSDLPKPIEHAIDGEIISEENQLEAQQNQDDSQQNPNTSIGNTVPTATSFTPATQDAFNRSTPVYKEPPPKSASQETQNKKEKVTSFDWGVAGNLDHQNELVEHNPLTNILPLRLIGYANETFESLAGPAAAITSLFGLNKLLNPKTAEAFKESVKIADAATHEGTAFAPYIKQSGLIGQNAAKTFKMVEDASYGLVLGYVAVDATNQGVQSYKKTKEETGDTQFATARGVQSFMGQGIWQLLASYAVPAIFVKELIYKNVKAGLTTVPNMMMGALAKPEPIEAKGFFGGIKKAIHPITGRLAKVFDANFLHETASAVAKSGKGSGRVALLSDAATAIIAGGISLASMPIVAGYLDPMFEKATQELFYKPTNWLLAKCFPEAYRNQIAQSEANKDKAERTMSDEEIQKRVEAIADKKASKVA